MLTFNSFGLNLSSCILARKHWYNMATPSLTYHWKEHWTTTDRRYSPLHPLDGSSVQKADLLHWVVLLYYINLNPSLLTGLLFLSYKSVLWFTLIQWNLSYEPNSLKRGKNRQPSDTRTSRIQLLYVSECKRKWFQINIWSTARLPRCRGSYNLVLPAEWTQRRERGPGECWRRYIRTRPRWSRTGLKPQPVHDKTTASTSTPNTTLVQHTHTHTDTTEIRTFSTTHWVTLSIFAPLVNTLTYCGRVNVTAEPARRLRGCETVNELVRRADFVLRHIFQVKGLIQKDLPLYTGTIMPLDRIDYL